MRRRKNRLEKFYYLYFGEDDTLYLQFTEQEYKHLDNCRIKYTKRKTLEGKRIFTEEGYVIQAPLDKFIVKDKDGKILLEENKKD